MPTTRKNSGRARRPPLRLTLEHGLVPPYPPRKDLWGLGCAWGWELRGAAVLDGQGFIYKGKRAQWPALSYSNEAEFGSQSVHVHLG